MPKTLVLYDTGNSDSSALAHAVADGARSVRFSEVDLRSLGALAPDGADLAGYDAFALDASSAGVTQLVERAGPLRSKVGALFGGSGADLMPLLALMGRVGMIILPPGTGAGDLAAADAESARVIGKRLADVTGWITHARSHHHH